MLLGAKIHWKMRKRKRRPRKRVWKYFEQRFRSSAEIEVTPDVSLRGTKKTNDMLCTLCR